MVLTKVKRAVAVCLVLGITALGAAGLISGTRATEPPGGTPDVPAPGQTDPHDLRGRVTELKQQLQQMQEKIAQLERATQAGRSEGKPDVAFLAERFQYRVPIQIGRTQTREGGRIEIKEVWGTRRNIEVGGQYLVRGKYVLPTGQRGKLYFYETATGDWSQPTTTLDLQSTVVSKQEGEFAVVHGMAGPGYFHLILADPERYSDSFANVYFGTGDNVWREEP